MNNESNATPHQAAEPDMRAICEALGFDPTNHHNAAKCPYCRPALHQAAEPPRCGVCGYPHAIGTFCRPPSLHQAAEPAPSEPMACLTITREGTTENGASWRMLPAGYAAAPGVYDLFAASPAPRALAEPGDFVMVPREPTRAMLMAWNEGERYGFKTFGDRYKAMIAAAPAPTPSDLLSDMDRGVLRMPFNLTMADMMSQVQFYGRVQSLLDRIDAARLSADGAVGEGK